MAVYIVRNIVAENIYEYMCGSTRDEHFVFNESEMNKMVVAEGNEVNKRKFTRRRGNFRLEKFLIIASMQCILLVASPA